MKIQFTKFALERHFNNPDFPGTKIIGFDTEAFLNVVVAMAEATEIKPGYAPFCKHVFVRNFTHARSGVAVITPKNKHLLQCGYKVRRPGEPAFLCRWFEGLEAPQAEWLDVVLYTGEQLLSEKGSDTAVDTDADYGIVSINAGLDPWESPMSPETIIRNALGRECGGSGVPFDPEEYYKAVTYWGDHALCL